MQGRRYIDPQVYIPPPDYTYDNNVGRHGNHNPSRFAHEHLNPHYHPPRYTESEYSASNYASLNGNTVNNFSYVSPGEAPRSNTTDSLYDYVQDGYPRPNIHNDDTASNDSSHKTANSYLSFGNAKNPDLKRKSRSTRILIAVAIVIVIGLLTAGGAFLYERVLKEEISEADTQQGNRPVDGTWTDWPEWSTCSVTCGDGIMTRNRTCDNPPPSFGGNDCEGLTSENQSCILTNCSVNGNWSEWLQWDSCSTTCDDGVKIRNRTCDNPAPVFGGEDCEGSATETQSCILANCSVNGNWSDWLPWDACSASCDEGVKTRNRTCDNPAPAFGGEDCEGSYTEEEVCMLKHCPIDGNWSSWQNWNDCSTTCGGGIRNRTRNCDNPTPQHNGLDCVGPNSETSGCDEATCPPPGVWGNWLEWSDCSKTCGEGVKIRTRNCDNSAGGECIGDNSETKDCQDWVCYDAWGDWSECSFTCGSGIRTRERTCEEVQTGQRCGWHYPTFKAQKTCTNPAPCESDFCESRSASCSYSHPTRCDFYITCDAGKNTHQRMCNVLMWYKVNASNPCEGDCDWEANVQCSL
ncbi:coadhesin-like [Pecten maximus]|uniref:coadhesin-like n=1 Tax=Pecten maximus TaxID=6579 RepID=UPI001458000B|nr:coadhesin-like [Pecten maximus]XP_033759820.1 coadhesin-like [Pecten maximus]